VSSLAALRTALDGGGAALILADPALVEAEREEVRAWLAAEGATQALLVAVAEPGDGDGVAQRLPFLDDVELRPLSSARLLLKLERAVETVHNRRAIRQLEGALGRKGDELNALNKIGVALSAERDIDKLLELILSKSRGITSADAGSLYLVERPKNGEEQHEQLRFKLAQNDTVDVPFEEFTIPLDETSVAGYVALTGRAVNVADAYRPPAGSPFRLSRAFDEQSGYRTKSMLVVPMRDHENKVIGVVQLINKKRTPDAVLSPVSLVEEEVVSFASVDEELAGSLASQAAVAFENAKLLRDIKHLFDSFVHAAVTAIEQRDPTTSGHSERVAVLTVGLAERVDRIATGRLAEVRLTRDQLQELRYAALLHDFGKVGVREKVLVKGKKLYFGQMNAIQQRFGYIGKSLEVEHLRRKLEAQSGGPQSEQELEALDRAYEERRAEVRRMWQTVMQANEPTVVEEESFRALMDLPQRTFRDWQDEEQPFLTPKELSALAIRKGSLSEEERREIESHVTHTYEFLSEIPWTGEFSRIPEIAWAHHEKLDGSGYPRRLTAPAIPLQSRMMTISDIYDALVAWDRPYKRAVSVEKALQILEEDARGGKLDSELLEVFIAARVYEGTLPK
jgi:HD-GYP domain-containing protein (c-di-GMP phosphodiesterase class II)